MSAGYGGDGQTHVGPFIKSFTCSICIAAPCVY